jgi:hypothetical protein
MDRSKFWPMASTTLSAASSSTSPVGWGKPSSSRIFSMVRVPNATWVMVRSHRSWTPSSSASSTSNGWAGIFARVRR